MPMGALPGSLVQVVRIAPFNGGFYLKIDNTNIVLRAQEADKILIDLDNNTHSGDNSQHT
jgi:Fe2+ transport system protein FeoA